jgi:alpha-D-ribose 1-methylphosphonate 5-triphosphate diphosphatase
MEAALEARKLGVGVIAGAPNVVRGGSHPGNVAAADMIRAGERLRPPAVVEAAWTSAATGDVTLTQAVATITDRAARMVSLQDRGRIRAGLRADLVQVRPHSSRAIVRRVWLARLLAFLLSLLAISATVPPLPSPQLPER